DQVSVRQDVAYKTTPGGDLKLDAYYPPDLKEGERRPAVLFAGVKDAPQWTGWGRLLAASGLVAITYDCPLPPSVPGAEARGDMAGLVAYVRGNADSLHVDGDRLGVLSVSRSAKYAVSAAMRGSP